MGLELPGTAACATAALAPAIRFGLITRPAIRRGTFSSVKHHRLDQLQPEHLEKLYVRMMRNGSARPTAHQAHRTALNEAVRGATSSATRRR
ncbi:MAG: hypothetical protein ACRDRA_02695 [Pseudonocardiaceae bacterium]